MQAPAQSGRRWWGGRDGVGDAGSDGGDDGGGGGSSYSGDGITKTLGGFHTQGARKEAYDQYTPWQRRGWGGVSGTTETIPHVGSRRHQGKRRRGLATATKYA